MMYLAKTDKDGKTIEFVRSTDIDYMRWYKGIREREGCKCVIYDISKEDWIIMNI